MTFDEVLDQVRELLQQRGRVTYRALQRRFGLDDEYVEDLKGELIKAEGVAADENGEVLVWIGGTGGKDIAKRSIVYAEKEQSAAPAARGQPLKSGQDAAERRQLTVMFCDLVNSTPLAEKLDPEDLRQVILAYQQTCVEQIRRFEGYLAQYMGDGLLVYFGYPQAHEDDAPRAIRAGLGMVAALPALNTRLQQTVDVLRDSPLQVRIGVHTGLVVAGDMGGGSYRDPLAIVGETPNIASRLQGIAEPDTVMISEATGRLVQGLFECDARGPQTLKGVSTPVPAYRVLRESEAQSRFEVAVRTGLMPLVGREEELGLLRRRWAQAKAGEGQVVFLSGEPGIGKSRLVQTLKEQASADGATRIEFRCSPYHQNSAYHPIIEHLQRLLRFAPHDTPQAKLTKLQQTLSAYRFPQADSLALLAALFSLPHPEEAPPLTMTPQKQKQKTQEMLVAWIIEEAERAAVYCAWEDLHWTDPSTLEVLTLFLDQVPTSRLLALLTFRPEFLPPWINRSYLSQLTLGRLQPPHVRTMVEQVSGGKPLPSEVVHQIVTKTDGVPLFVEELTKTVLESGWLRAADDHYELSAPLPSLAIPSSLHDSLMARLDRLAPVRELAQVGATIGREFSYELLHAVSLLDEETLQDGLRQLVEAELLYQRGMPPQATYLFKHALVQDTAYQSLLKSKRQQLHQQLAQVLAEQFAETAKTQPELLAHHYTEAGLIEQAIPYWQQAGQRANQRSAMVEAISHITKGLDLLKALPDTPEHARQELMLQTTLGRVLALTKGFGAPEVAHAYTRARALCRQVDESPQHSPVLLGLCAFYENKQEFKTAHELAEQLLRLAQKWHDPYSLVWAYFFLGDSLQLMGELALARVYLEQAVAHYDPQVRALAALRSGVDPGVYGLGSLASVLWSLGYPEQAVARSREALALAEGILPLNLTNALSYADLLHVLRREGQAVQEYAERLMEVCGEQELRLGLAHGTTHRGWALVAQGRVEEGIAQMGRGLAAERATGSELLSTVFMAELAKAYGKAGQTHDGLASLTEALALAESTGERVYEVELYRVKGELTLQANGRSQESSVKEAEACFHKAIEIAREQQARSLELRAVTSLSRLWQQQGKKDEARQMLGEIYGWFTEGFDTKDLQEAKALLEELH